LGSSEFGVEFAVVWGLTAVEQKDRLDAALVEEEKEVGEFGE